MGEAEPCRVAFSRRGRRRTAERVAARGKAAPFERHQLVGAGQRQDAGLDEPGPGRQPGRRVDDAMQGHVAGEGEEAKNGPNGRERGQECPRASRGRARCAARAVAARMAGRLAGSHIAATITCQLATNSGTPSHGGGPPSTRARWWSRPTLPDACAGIASSQALPTATTSSDDGRPGRASVPIRTAEPDAGWINGEPMDGCTAVGPAQTKSRLQPNGRVAGRRTSRPARTSSSASRRSWLVTLAAIRELSKRPW